MRSARGRGCGGVQGNESSWRMSRCGDVRSARGRGGVGKERAGVSVGGEQSVKNEWQMSGHGDMRRGAAAERNRNFRGRERVRF